MSQSDYNIGANPTGLAMRTEINTIFDSILTNNSGSTSPAVTSAFMMWVDTSNATYYYLKIRNHDNTAWVVLASYTVATKTLTVVDSSKIPIDLSSSTDKPTPIDADLIPLSDSASSFSLKKLTFANLKATILNALNGLSVKTTPVDADILLVGDSASSFIGKKLTFANLKTYLAGLYVGLTGAQSIDGVKTFTSSPIVPTPTAGDNSTKVATTAYVDGKMVRGTAVNSTSGTSIDFTGIPNWIKRITVMFNGVSTNGSSNIQIQLGSTTIQTTSYSSVSHTSSSAVSSTTGLLISYNNSSTYTFTGGCAIELLTGNTYIQKGNVANPIATRVDISAGSVTLSGVLDRIRITTVNGTDTFDAGSINIIYEG